RVRAITGGDLTGDGAWELVVEAGARREPGEVQVWEWQAGAYKALRHETLRLAPAFGLAVAQDGDRHLLAVADDRGRAALYRLTDAFELLAESGRTLGWAVA